jgi:hypothetical protein
MKRLFPILTIVALLLSALSATCVQSRAAGLDPGRTRPLRAQTGNRAVTVDLRNLALLERYGDTAAPAGSLFLVVSTQWENVLPLKLSAENEKLATGYKIPNLADHVYLVINGYRVARLNKDAAGLPGHIPARDFLLPALGDTASGNLVFDVPRELAAKIETLELRYYDMVHGNFHLQLAGEPPGEASKPLSLPEKNEVLELGVFRLERTRTLGGQTAAPSMTFITIDLRARSLFAVDADATVFDPNAQPGARAKVGTVADWKESRRYLQLVADGEVAFAPLPSSTLADEPRFLPDVFTGGDVVFLGPEKAASLELRCDFPNARSSLDGKEFRPQGLTLVLEGQRPQFTAPEPIIGPIADDPFQVTVIAAPDAPFDAGASDAARLVLLDFTALNAGKKGEFLQPVEQLQIALGSGKQVTLDPAAAPARPALPLLWVPAGERRSFTAAYRVPAAEAKLRLMYRGGTFAKAFFLPALDRAIVAGGESKPPPAPADGEKKAAAAENKAAAVENKAGVPPAVVRPTPPPAPAKPAERDMPRKPVAETQPQAERIAKVAREPKGLAGVGLTPERVNQAIDRGADFLWKFILESDIKRDRKRLGGAREHSIASLALVHAGAHKRHADFDANLREYLNAIEPERLEAYQAGILCMLIETYGDPSYVPTLKVVARYLLELQGAQGSWSYSRVFPRGFFKGQEDDRVLKVSGGQPLEEPRAKQPLARHTDWKEGIDGDNSTSQYALLGLHAASRSGLSIDAEVWRRSLARYREGQGKDGNWAYHGQTSMGYGSMTCAGICSLALTRHELGERDPAADPAIDAGLGWLEKHFSLTVHPGRTWPEQWRFYYLYSLERVGRVLDVELIGPHEWYPLGARHLVDSQTEEGGWVGKFEELDPRLATSFALLFLTRATASLKPVATPLGGDGTLKTGVQLPKGSRYYFILDASGSMTAELDGKTKWEIARGAVSRLVEELPDNAEVALRVYGHRKRAIEEGASEDTALEVPLKRLVKKEMLARIEALKPRGKTPMARSLLEAKRDLGSAAAENPVTVVLLTDGGEDTLPRQDPLAAAAEIAKLKGVRFHIVGFDIGREDWKAQLGAMAVKGEGHYWPARSADSLLGELRSAVFGMPAGFSVLDEQGKAAGAGSFGDSLALPEGRYLFRASYAGVDHEELFWINTAASTSVVFNAAKVAQLRLPSAAAGATSVPAAAPSVKPALPSPAASAKPAGPSPAPKAKFCTGCGKALGANVKFCAGCGKKAGG